MKEQKSKFGYISIYLFMLFISLFSCSDENERIIPEIPKDPIIIIDGVNTLLNPVDNYKLNLENIPSAEIQFEWNDPNLKKETNKYYELVFFKEGDKSLDSITRFIVPKSNNNFLKISHEKLDDVCALAGIEESMGGVIVWGVNIIHNNKTIKSKTFHRLNMIRFAISNSKKNLYLTGSGTEEGTVIEKAIKFKRLTDSQFELFTWLEKGKDFKIIDNPNLNEMNVFSISKNKLVEDKPENQNLNIPKDAPYRISIDLDKMQATVEEVTEFGLYSCIQEYNSIKMGYEGNGIWTSESAGTTGYVLLYNRSWGSEGRYKFMMKLIDAETAGKRTVHWGSDTQNSFNIKEVPVTQWDNVWAFSKEFDQKNIKLEVSLNSQEEYTHSIERYELPNNFWNTIANESTSSFLSAFWLPQGYFRNGVSGSINKNDYWPEAHAMDVVIDAYLRTGDEKYRSYIDSFYEGMLSKNGKRKPFWNEFYDDMAWHGLTHLRAFDLTNDTRYEGSSKLLWEYIISGTLAKGGIPWKNGQIDGSLVSTAPSSIIASRIWSRYDNYKELKGYTSKEWAVKLYDWVRDNHFVSETGRVFEKADDEKSDWTYNSGTFIGAAIELYKESRNEKYLNDAIKVADYQLNHRVKDGVILHDWAEQEDHDVSLFKGIFIRYLTQLILVESLPLVKRNEYVKFVERNAQNLWSSSTTYTPHILYSYAWYHPIREKEKTWLRAQISGATLIEAAALLEKKGLLN